MFTGDALLIGGAGRSDFQNGSPDSLFDSFENKLRKLPPATVVYPGHDYKGRTHSTIGDELRANALFGKPGRVRSSRGWRAETSRRPRTWASCSRRTGRDERDQSPRSTQRGSEARIDRVKS